MTLRVQNYCVEEEEDENTFDFPMDMNYVDYSVAEKLLSSECDNVAVLKSN